MKAIIELVTGLNVLEGLMQQPKTTIAELLALGDVGAGGSPLSRVRYDDFVGMKDLDAAKKNLDEKASDARAFQEIVDAVKAGGGKVDSEEALRTGLSRSTFEIIKIGDRYGSLKHYPHIKRGGKKRKSTDNGESNEASAEVKTETDEKTVDE